MNPPGLVLPGGERGRLLPYPYAVPAPASWKVVPTLF
jgi:hypothetical protein